jgi:hypothetical protein
MNREPLLVEGKQRERERVHARDPAGWENDGKGEIVGGQPLCKAGWEHDGKGEITEGRPQSKGGFARERGDSTLGRKRHVNFGLRHPRGITRPFPPHSSCVHQLLLVALPRLII